ncbi:hypothetical protein [Deinococcus budaensis]|uniref:Uncharacterized protein n=1 Tax=Deinococcus budaensis TaxID=1665626 RepID=A0A7W8LQ65_9DEIO|nr:hypothetical protein [Deinococcus budaensis]MBB5234501.1 hypothetical protein [Deinococcus budaensis]
MTDRERHDAANAEQVRLLREALAEAPAEPRPEDTERPPPLVAVFACLFAALGLGLNLLGYGGEVEALVPALWLGGMVVLGLA